MKTTNGRYSTIDEYLALYPSSPPSVPFFHLPTPELNLQPTAWLSKKTNVIDSLFNSKSFGDNTEQSSSKEDNREGNSKDGTKISVTDYLFSKKDIFINKELFFYQLLEEFLNYEIKSYEANCIVDAFMKGAGKAADETWKLNKKKLDIQHECAGCEKITSISVSMDVLMYSDKKFSVVKNNLQQASGLYFNEFVPSHFQRVKFQLLVNLFLKEIIYNSTSIENLVNRNNITHQVNSTIELSNIEIEEITKLTKYSFILFKFYRRIEEMCMQKISLSFFENIQRSIQQLLEIIVRCGIWKHHHLIFTEILNSHVLWGKEYIYFPLEWNYTIVYHFISMFHILFAKLPSSAAISDSTGIYSKCFQLNGILSENLSDWKGPLEDEVIFSTFFDQFPFDDFLFHLFNIPVIKFSEIKNENNEQEIEIFVICEDILKLLCNEYIFKGKQLVKTIINKIILLFHRLLDTIHILQEKNELLIAMKWKQFYEKLLLYTIDFIINSSPSTHWKVLSQLPIRNFALNLSSYWNIFLSILKIDKNKKEFHYLLSLLDERTLTYNSWDNLFTNLDDYSSIRISFIEFIKKEEKDNIEFLLFALVNIAKRVIDHPLAISDADGIQLEENAMNVSLVNYVNTSYPITILSKEIYLIISAELFSIGLICKEIYKTHHKIVMELIDELLYYTNSPININNLFNIISTNKKQLKLKSQFKFIIGNLPWEFFQPSIYQLKLIKTWLISSICENNLSGISFQFRFCLKKTFPNSTSCTII